jgi:hypothetical protein
MIVMLPAIGRKLFILAGPEPDRRQLKEVA